MAAVILSLVFVFVYVRGTLNTDVDPMYDDDGRYYSDYDLSLFVRDENGNFFYEDDNYYSILGTDVSEHQGPIDFAKVKAQGIDFVFLRVGYRGYVSGKIHKDLRFEQYYREARTAGLKVGAYFFSAATGSDEAREEAAFTYQCLKGKQIDIGVAYDLEEVVGSVTRMDSNSLHTNTVCATFFMDYFREKGYKSWLYASPSFLRNNYDLELIKDYPLWLAFYSNEMKYKYSFEIWQYSPSAKIDGINTEADINLMLIKKDRGE